MSAMIARLDQRMLSVTNRLNDNLRENFDRTIAQERHLQAARRNAQVQQQDRPNIVRDGGALHVDTGNRSDHVKIEQHGEDVTLTIDGKVTTHEDVTGIVVKTNGGDDIVETSIPWFVKLVPLPLRNTAPVESYVFVDAGDGDDVVDLSAATGNTVIVGAGGEDFLVGGSGSTCDNDFRKDEIFGDYMSASPEERAADTIVVQADSPNHLAVTDATWDPLDTLVELPGAAAKCAPEGPQVDPEILALATSMGEGQENG